MKKVCILLLLLGNAVTAVRAQQAAAKKVSYVNPFVGTGSADTVGLPGCTFPGPAVPFGFVQLSPDTKEEIDAHPTSGYDYNAKYIYGFSHTHLSGTGIADLADILMMPVSGVIKPEPGNVYRSRFSHQQEVAKPGYYSVQLLDYHIRAELAATMHAGFHRYTFPEGQPANLVIDMDHSSKKGNTGRATRIVASEIRIVDDHTIEGFRIVTAWAKLRRVYFYAKFSQPFTSNMTTEAKSVYPHANFTSGTANIKAVITFNNLGGKQVLVKVGVSHLHRRRA